MHFVLSGHLGTMQDELARLELSTLKAHWDSASLTMSLSVLPTRWTSTVTKVTEVWNGND